MDKQESGFSLILVLFIFMVLSIFSVAMLNTGSSLVTGERVIGNSEQAGYYAQSGIEYVYQLAEKNDSTVRNCQTNGSETWAFSIDGEYWMNIECQRQFHKLYEGSTPFDVLIFTVKASHPNEGDIPISRTLVGSYTKESVD